MQQNTSSNFRSPVQYVTIQDCRLSTYYQYVIGMNSLIWRIFLKQPMASPARPFACTKRPRDVPDRPVTRKVYKVPRCKTTTHQRSFWVRTIRTWNALTNILDLSEERQRVQVFNKGLLQYCIEEHIRL